MRSAASRFFLFGRIIGIALSGAGMHCAESQPLTPTDSSPIGHPLKQQQNEQLFMSAMTGELEEAQLSLEAGADPNHSNHYGITPLLVVAGGSARNVAIMEELLKGGAAVNQPDKEGWTALVYAVSSGQMAFVDLLLRSGAHVNVRTIEKLDIDVSAPANRTPTGGWTPLTRAAFRGQPMAIRALIAAGADLTAVTGGRTALQLALAGAIDSDETGHAEAAAVLREAEQGQAQP